MCGNCHSNIHINIIWKHKRAMIKPISVLVFSTVTVLRHKVPLSDCIDIHVHTKHKVHNYYCKSIPPPPFMVLACRVVIT